MNSGVRRLAVLAAMVMALWTTDGVAQSPPAPVSGAEAEPSIAGSPASTRLEASYSDRAGEPLKLFGYDLFGAGLGGDGPALGAVQDTHVLGIGDQLQVSIRGGAGGTRTYPVGLDGMLALDGRAPIPAGGRTLGAVRADIEATVAAAEPTAKVHVALATIRKVSVLVAGEVERSGRYELSAFATVIDALYAAGGVRRTGSLRAIRVTDAAGRRRTVDLYGFLTGRPTGATGALAEGDWISVPPIGRTVAVGGAVKAPGIFELPPDTVAMPPETLLELAGGPLRPGPPSSVLLGFDAEGRERTSALAATPAARLSDGDILVYRNGHPDRAGTVALVGAVTVPGIRPLEKARTLRALLTDGTTLAPNAYALFGVVERFDPSGALAETIPFAPIVVMGGGTDLALVERDRVRILSRPEVASLLRPTTTPPPLTQGPGQIAAQDEPSPSTMPDTALVAEDAPGALLRRMARAAVVHVRGSVGIAGDYPVGAPVALADMIAVSGGLPPDADPGSVEITVAATHDGSAVREPIRLTLAASDTAAHVGPGDTVRVLALKQRGVPGTVDVTGEVLRPGRLDLLPGETLSSALRRAGGLTPQAYPRGAVFTRISARRAQEIGLRSFAADLDRSLALSLMRTNPPDAARVEMVRGFADSLRSVPVLGRITVQADPAILADNPDQDILLESGDRIHFPKRPMTVTVSGEVMAPASLQYRPRKTVDQYIREAGGLSATADTRRILIMFPDGSALPVRDIETRGPRGGIPAGSIIVVPRDPEPFEFLPMAQSVATILGQLSLATVAVNALTAY